MRTGGSDGRRCNGRPGMLRGEKVCTRFGLQATDDRGMTQRQLGSPVGQTGAI
jgi:hypothetical protein